jgi:hypothetical protein
VAERVDITLPTGELATVPQEDLSQALAAGARVTSKEEATEGNFGDTSGQLGSFALGAARMASFGLSDSLYAETANVIGGEQARKETLEALRTFDEVNPMATLGGEAAGLLIGAGQGIGAAGARAEAAVASRVGSGLGGRALSLGARGAVEGAAIEVQHEISEAILGDTDVAAEKLVAAAGRGSLIGGGIGAVLGVGAHAASKLVRRAPGRASHALLDEMAGVEGAGVALREEASATERFIADGQRVGWTSDQAAKAADELASLAKAKASQGPLSSIMDEGVEAYIAAKAGGNAEMRDLLSKGYSRNVTRIARQEEILDTQARKLAEVGTRTFRAEDALNEIQFLEKPEQMARLVDKSLFGEARDASLRALQDMDAVLTNLEATSTKGGAEVAVRRLRKVWQDSFEKIAKTELSGGEAAARDLFIGLDNAKRQVGKAAQFGKTPFGLSEGAREFEGLYERLRLSLEDESVWGAAGAAQREWNQSFSSGFARRKDFGQRLAVAIDEVSGRPVAEIDAGKAKSVLRNLEGAEGDQAVKSTHAFIDNFRSRLSAIEKYGEIGPSQAKRIAEGRKAIAEFEATFGEAQKEARIVARLRSMKMEEEGKSLGGIIGLGADILTSPAKTLDRLASARSTIHKFEKAISGGLDRYFSGKGKGLAEGLTRSREDIIKEIQEVKGLVASPQLVEERAARLAGDLPEYAPKTAAAVGGVTSRAVAYLANAVPPGRVPTAVFMDRVRPRYTDAQLAEYERKAVAVKDPQTVVEELEQGKLNRDGIEAVKAVYPSVFAEMQEATRKHLEELAREGKTLPLRHEGAVAILLEVPPSDVWTPSFIAEMQASKQPQPEGGGEPTAGPQRGASRRAIKTDDSRFLTEAAQIEGRDR